MIINDNKKRELIKYLACACAGLVTIDTVLPVSPKTSMNNERLFNDATWLTLRQLCETIIPRTKTPGAIDAGVHDFIVGQLQCCTDKDKRERFISDLKQLTEITKQQHKKLFHQLSSAGQHDMVQRLAHGKPPFSEKDIALFVQLKSLTLLGYYTSESGVSAELAYDPVPGGYDGGFRITGSARSWSI